MKGYYRVLWTVLLSFIVMGLQAAGPQLRLPRLVGDSMVLQRDKPVTVWGWSSPGEEVMVDFNERVYTTRATVDGKWRLTLAALGPGGPYTMKIRSGGEERLIREILVGDVWLCSGQSNMEYKMAGIKDRYAAEVASSANTYIRHFLVRTRTSFVPVDDVEGRWKGANPENVLEFTAVGYFFARALYDRYRVPIGLIHSSVGGTPAEAWTSEEGLKEFPAFREKATWFRDSGHLDSVKARDKRVMDEWYRRQQAGDRGGDGAGGEKRDADTTSWKTLRFPGFWEDQGAGSIDGVVWVKKDVFLSAGLRGKDALLDLGMIDDQDTTWVNGHKAGSSPNKYTRSRYHVTASWLHAGTNTITIRIIDREGKGGLIPGKPHRLVFDDTAIDLEGEWKYRVGVALEPLPVNTFTTLANQPEALYDGMIAPLLPYTIKGALWYQGEANTPRAAEYRRLLPAMIRDWRDKWGMGDFPFLIVQLANYMAVKEQPSESHWAELRESQSLIATSVPASGLAVTIDIGETNDVHPSDKKDVGERLALVARKIVFKEKDIVFSGPTLASVKQRGDSLILSFSNIGSGLVAKGGELRQLAIAGQDHTFSWAHAFIRGDQVIVWKEGTRRPLAVRYAWADNPEGCNLYNKEGLPAGPFRTDEW